MVVPVAQGCPGCSTVPATGGKPSVDNLVPSLQDKVHQVVTTELLASLSVFSKLI